VKAFNLGGFCASSLTFISTMIVAVTEDSGPTLYTAGFSLGIMVASAFLICWSGESSPR
jgi:hypothetical protein